MKIASVDVTRCLSCIVGNEGARFCKAVPAGPEISHVVHTFLLLFKTWPTSPTMQLELSDITAGNFLDYMHLPLTHTLMCAIGTILFRKGSC